LPSHLQAFKAYHELKLSEPRTDDRLPPLENFLADLRDWEEKKKQEKA